MATKNPWGANFGGLATLAQQRLASGEIKLPTPAAPAPPPPPRTPTALPVDPSYDATIGAAQRRRDTAVAGLRGQRTQSLLDYGYNETNGALSVDPSNAFSKASLLQKSYAQGRARTGTSLAAGGQLYSGAYQTAQDDVNNQELQAQDSLQKQVMRYLAANTTAQAGAGTDYEDAAAMALGDRLSRAASNPLYSPEADTSAPATPVTAARAAKPPAFKPYTGKIYTSFKPPKKRR